MLTTALILLVVLYSAIDACRGGFFPCYPPDGHAVHIRRLGVLEHMALIPTGFGVKPLVGAVDSNDRLARYLPMGRFRQLLEQKGLWFTRVYRWKDNDACEASLLPAYRQYLRSSIKAEAEFLHLKTLMEFQLRANLGCCFSLFDGAENDLMWRSYTGEPDYGVIIITRASAIHDAVTRGSSGRQFLARVKYLSDRQAARLRVADCAHFRVKSGQKTWDVSECAFFKRDAFSAEREARCVVSAGESWTVLLHEFMREERIPELLPGARVPTDQPYLRIDMRDSMLLVSPRDRVALVTIPQMRKLTTKIEDECERYLDDSTFPATSRGMYVSFDLRHVEEVILHPRLAAMGGSARESVTRFVEEAGLGGRLRVSQLYASGW